MSRPNPAEILEAAMASGDDGCMRIKHLGHSCVLIESAGKRILLDPGAFSDAWHDLDAVDAVFVTHQHADHADPKNLPSFLGRHLEALIAVEASVPEHVELPDDARRLEAGETIWVGDVQVRTVGGWHAIIHDDIARVHNVGLLVSEPDGPTLFHPGDALETAPTDVDFVCIPLQAPWSATKEVIDFTRAVGAPRGMLIHDGLLNDQGYQTVSQHIVNLGGSTIEDLRDGRWLEI